MLYARTSEKATACGRLESRRFVQTAWGGTPGSRPNSPPLVITIPLKGLSQFWLELIAQEERELTFLMAVLMKSVSGSAYSPPKNGRICTMAVLAIRSPHLETKQWNLVQRCIRLPFQLKLSLSA